MLFKGKAVPVAKRKAPVVAVPESRRSADSVSASGGRTQSAYDFILRKLVSGEYTPGQRIDVTVIAKTLGISRQPIMNALQQLSNKDLVQITPQVGSIAAVYTPDEWSDFQRYFAAGEALITQLAAERRADDEVETLLSLSHAVAHLVERAKGHSMAMEYRKANQDFHRQIHKMARSQILDRHMAALWDRVDYYISTLGHSQAFTARTPKAVEEHEGICRAIADRDGELARRLAEAHILAQVGAVL
jgi:DNA-binding GntR family transcriptional regulator